ncbi:MAG: dihydroneopterin aldolase [Microbacterium sp.]|uniref:dihydroneopterin aldolase n=1 Tax=Microbacterium sp. TaxID=51671 RepID=UPI003A8970D2
MDVTDRIVLRGIRARGHHGVYDFEREQGQDFVVDATLHLALHTAAATDDVADTVHYGEVAEQITAIVGGEPVNLIETLAERIAAAVLQDERVRTVEVTVHKPQAPIAQVFDDVAVTIVRSRA